MKPSLEAAFKAYLFLSLWPALSFLAALAADLTYLRTGSPAWSQAAVWAIALGLAGGLLTGLPGTFYFLKAIPRTDSLASKLASAHMVLDVALLSLFAFNLAMRLVLGPRLPWVVWLGTYLTVVGVLELGATGLIGWKLWRMRCHRLRVAMLRGEQPLGASRRP